jgi:hypothetical protein
MNLAPAFDQPITLAQLAIAAGAVVVALSIMILIATRSIKKTLKGMSMSTPNLDALTAAVTAAVNQLNADKAALAAAQAAVTAASADDAALPALTAALTAATTPTT